MRQIILVILAIALTSSCFSCTCVTWKDTKTKWVGFKLASSYAIYTLVIEPREYSKDSVICNVLVDTKDNYSSDEIIILNTDEGISCDRSIDALKAGNKWLINIMIAGDRSAFNLSACFESMINLSDVPIRAVINSNDQSAIKDWTIGQIEEELNILIQNPTNIQYGFIPTGQHTSHISLEFAKFKGTVEDTNSTIIDTICAVKVFPDNIWINDQQKLVDESDWNTIVDDNEYYNHTAQSELKKVNIQTIYASRTSRYIKFIKSDGTVYVADFMKMIDAWGLILFNGKDDPVLWSDTSIEKEIKEIFGK